MEVVVKVKKLRPDAKIPCFGSVDAACADLSACIDHDFVTIAPHTTRKIGTGLAMEIPRGYGGNILARSGISSDCYLRPGNCVGKIDSDYRGEIKVAVHNDSDTTQIVENGERIAQIEIVEKIDTKYLESADLSETERGDGGFGSSGTKEVKKKRKRDPEPIYDEW